MKKNNYRDVTNYFNTTCLSTWEGYYFVFLNLTDKDSQEPNCITKVAGFEPVWLNPFVVETAYLQFKQEHGVKLETATHE